MCGILGTINISERHSELDLIRHRGPDAFGEVDLLIGGYRVYLGHRRLSILDLSPAGDQPMRSPDGSKLIVYNGEVYNHQELRSQLSDIAFIGHSDTETILHLLSRHGLTAVPSLNGIFAFAFLNASTNQLYLVRDPFGVKPLYYCQEGNALAFCSEIKPIVRLMHQTLSTDNLAELLRLRYSPSPDTLFKNIRKVRPGHIVEVDLSKERIRVTERPYLLSVPPITQALSMEMAQSEYGGFLRRAVERQLMSDVEVGIFLSGGMDSALVAQFAQSRLPKKMKYMMQGNCP